MAEKFKLTVMFVAVVSVFCFVLNIAGTNSLLYACDSCASKTKQCSPGKGSDSSYCKEESKCNKGGSHCISELLKLARCAKKELLKEKIKANLEKKSGAKLDKVADLLVDAMIEEHKAAGEDKGRRAALEASIKEIFTEKSEETETSEK
jgi:hypothetical protein